MERARTSCAICIQASVAAFAGAVALSAQTNTPPQDWASQSPGTEERQAIAESLIGREEAASGRMFDPVFRTETAARLARLPMEDLLQAQAAALGGLSALGDSQANLVYTPLTPCRIIDTRVAGGVIAAGATRDFLVTGTSLASQGGHAGGCGIPYGPATAAVINFVAVNPAGPGNLRITPFGKAIPLASLMNYTAGVNIANGLAVTICDPSATTCGKDFTIQANVNATHLVADVQGYFQRAPDLRLDAGLRNTALGVGALAYNTTGLWNSSFGDTALSFNRSGTQNSAFGVSALAANALGSNNSAFGSEALLSNAGDANAAFGSFALWQKSSGSHNAAFGTLALWQQATGSGNVAVGDSAGLNLESGDDNIYVGNAGTSTESNVIRIGTVGTHTATFIAGIAGATAASGVAVYVDPSGRLGTTTCSRRYKEQITDMDSESEVLMKLRPVSFYYNRDLDATHTRQYGLVAEEVAEVAPELVLNDENGAPQSVRYHFVNAMLLNEIQKQRRRLGAQDERLRAQDAEIRELRAQQTQVQELKEQLARLEARLAK